MNECADTQANRKKDREMQIGLIVGEGTPSSDHDECGQGDNESCDQR